MQAIGVALTWPVVVKANPSGYVLFLVLVAFTILSFLIWKIGQGKNWARTVYLVLFVLAVRDTLRGISVNDLNLAVILLGLASMIIQSMALIMIFTSPGKEWFSPQNRAQ